jgi:antitoxin component YwqK of YwqJK toxin-antitoxin module
MNMYRIIRIVLIFHFSSCILHLASAQDSLNVNGFQKFFYPTGIISSEGTMKAGKPDGYWKSYFENGKIKSEGNRKNFEIDSTWKFYNEEGKLILEVNYKYGKKNGIKTTYLDKETIKENFISDLKEGYTRYYYKDGNLKMEVPFVKGLEQGLGKEYSFDGNIISIIEYKKGFIVDRLKINRRDQNNLKQGRWYTFYNNGNVKVEGIYKDDKKNGYFKEYTENGDLISVTKFINDVKQEDAEEITKLDVENEYYPNGKLKASGTFRNGIPEGIRREYNQEGEIERSFIFRNGYVIGEGIVKEDGTKEGHWKEFYSNGTLRAEGDYKDGKPVGEWKYFYPDSKQEQTGKYTASGKKTGTWKWYFENGQLMTEEDYKNGVKEGVHTEYDETGKVVEEGEYLNGTEEGPWFTVSGDFYEKGTYRDGLKNGKWTSLYLITKDNKTDSILSFTGNFIDDNPDGKHIYYWENGKIKDEGNYITGKKDGDWIKYNSDGTMFLIITYQNGVEIRYDGVKIKPAFDSEEQ